ncbi:hypothetical protein ALC57_17653 [Trachymyrmex cornetzi]|uniref:Uncharacterized protein n=1 Tax=Trachymyrmex cornetzi TaxID=471704 RepID=A0A151ITB8_9HYME|nr:hypothetical protein ALC57_17653 [Trachymyrmex cornetzi]
MGKSKKRSREKIDEENVARWRKKLRKYQDRLDRGVKVNPERGQTESTEREFDKENQPANINEQVKEAEIMPEVPEKSDLDQSKVCRLSPDVERWADVREFTANRQSLIEHGATSARRTLADTYSMTTFGQCLANVGTMLATGSYANLGVTSAQSKLIHYLELNERFLFVTHRYDAQQRSCNTDL